METLDIAKKIAKINDVKTCSISPDVVRADRFSSYSTLDEKIPYETKVLAVSRYKEPSGKNEFVLFKLNRNRKIKVKMKM